MIEVKKPGPNNIEGLNEEFENGGLDKEYKRIAQEYLDENPILNQIIEFNKEQYGNENIKEILDRIRQDNDFLERLEVQSKKDISEQLEDTRQAIISAASSSKEIIEAENPLSIIINNFEEEKSGVKTRSRDELNVSDLVSQRLTAIETISKFLRRGGEKGIFEGDEGKEKKKSREDTLKEEQEKLAAVLVAIKRAA
jgi:hypothetical protein